MHLCGLRISEPLKLKINSINWQKFDADFGINQVEIILSVQIYHFKKQLQYLNLIVCCATVIST